MQFLTTFFPSPEFNSITYTSKLPYSIVCSLDDDLTRANGIGEIYTDNNDAYPSGDVHAFLRGGYWKRDVNAGVFTLFLDGSPLHVYTSIGFRCVR